MDCGEAADLTQGATTGDPEIRMLNRPQKRRLRAVRLSGRRQDAGFTRADGHHLAVETIGIRDAMTD